MILVTSMLTVAAFAFWVLLMKRRRGFPACFVLIFPASLINCVLAIAFLFLTPGGAFEKDLFLWMLVTPFVVYNAISFLLSAALMPIGGDRAKDGSEGDLLKRIATLAAFYGFTIVLYPVVFLALSVLI